MNRINRFQYSFTDEELIAYLVRSAKNNNGYPKWSDFTAANSEYPGASTLKRRFGSFSNACEAAGFTKEYEYITKGAVYSYYEALNICFTEFGYKIPNNRKSIDKNAILSAIVKGGNIPKNLGYSCNKTGALFMRKVFTDKPRNSKGYNWLLGKKGWLYCTSCNLVKETINFRKSKDTHYSHCKECEILDKNYYVMQRKTAKIMARPAWGQEGIEDFYKKCPEGYHVDHIIPLRGKYICGLHVLANLQYLTAKDNLAKSNYHESEEYWICNDICD